MLLIKKDFGCLGYMHDDKVMICFQGHLKTYIAISFSEKANY